MPVILTTDAFFFVLIIALAFYFIRIFRQRHLALAWSKLLRNRSATVALIFLAFYFLVAILDSLHYHPVASYNEQNRPVYSAQVLSVLDNILEPLKRHGEKTYSEPLASYAYVKEIIESDDGRLIQDYPRLKYGGSHLMNPRQDDTFDIAMAIVKSIVIGLAISALFILIICVCISCYCKRRLSEIILPFWRASTDIPWRAMAGAFTSIVIAIVAVTILSGEYHVFGTDKIGQDILYQAIKSVRTGVLIGTLTTLIMLPFAFIFGICAGYFLGWIDDVIQYLYTTLNSIPGVLLIAASILMLHIYMEQNPEQFTDLVSRADTRLLFLCIILGITSWTGLCRLLRAETLKVKELDYIKSAKVLGASHLRIIARHIAPNIMHIAFITIALDFSGLVLAEVVLSYVSIGVDPSMHSWGNMINSARLELAREPVVWWPLLVAIGFLFVLVLCANLFADGVRDAFDPNTER